MDRWFSWYDTPAQRIVNPAATIFAGTLNQVGQTFPMLNGRRTWSDGNAALAQMAAAIIGPSLERSNGRTRLIEPGCNTASALIQAPSPGPWNAAVDVSVVRRFGALQFESSLAIRPLVSSLPANGAITIHIPANSLFTANTLAHEQRHAADIRQACESAFASWNAAINTLAGQWFATEAEMDVALFQAASLTSYTGTRLQRLAASIYLPVGLAANVLHLVDEHHQMMIDRPQWSSSARVLSFSLVELTRPPATAARRVENYAARV